MTATVANLIEQMAKRGIKLMTAAQMGNKKPQQRRQSLTEGIKKLTNLKINDSGRFVK